MWNPFDPFGLARAWTQTLGTPPSEAPSAPPPQATPRADTVAPANKAAKDKATPASQRAPGWRVRGTSFVEPGQVVELYDSRSRRSLSMRFVCLLDGRAYFVPLGRETQGDLLVLEASELAQLGLRPFADALPAVDGGLASPWEALLGQRPQGAVLGTATAARYLADVTRGAESSNLLGQVQVGAMAAMMTPWLVATRPGSAAQALRALGVRDVPTYSATDLVRALAQGKRAVVETRCAPTDVTVAKPLSAGTSSARAVAPTRAYVNEARAFVAVAALTARDQLDAHDPEAGTYVVLVDTHSGLPLVTSLRTLRLAWLSASAVDTVAPRAPSAASAWPGITRR